MQDTGYPDPAQLRTFAEEPMPFHDIKTADLELIVDDDRMSDHTLRSGVGNVEYRYEPSYIRLEEEEGEHYYAKEYPDWSFNHSEAWEKAEDIEIQGDFICATGFVSGMESDTAMYQAFWILDKTIITNDV